jgi:hypothetical protein
MVSGAVEVDGVDASRVPDPDSPTGHLWNPLLIMFVNVTLLTRGLGRITVGTYR